jgi:PadR family transcriptional regulator, regulatory protein PadR
MVAGDTGNWSTQLRRGVAEHCVLACLRQSEQYGFELARTLSSADGVIASEGTLYPLLSRLRKANLVETNWRESVEGPPRRYYLLTPLGHTELEMFTEQWKRFRDSVDRILDQEVTS